MGNMSYCRFENTANDLDDCQEALENLLQGGKDEDGEPEVLSGRELTCAKQLAITCQNILELLAEATCKPVEDLTEGDIESALDDANDSAVQARNTYRHEQEKA